MIFNAYIYLMAAIGQACVGFLIVFAFITAFCSGAEEKQITRPLPAEPLPTTAALEEVR